MDNSLSGDDLPEVESLCLNISNISLWHTTIGEHETDKGALLYIIVVLVFYSTAVVVMMIHFLRTEKREIDEEVVLTNFFKNMPTRRTETERQVNKVAVAAFHTMTSVSYSDETFDEHSRIRYADETLQLLTTDV